MLEELSGFLDSFSEVLVGNVEACGKFGNDLGVGRIGQSDLKFRVVASKKLHEMFFMLVSPGSSVGDH